MKRTLQLCLLSLFFTTTGCSQSNNKTDFVSVQTSFRHSTNKENCNWCGASEASENSTWHTFIAPRGEPGEKLIISGTVYLSDGKTPAKDIIIYVYHTNKEGIYPKKGNEKGNGKYHGYLRGWMRTDKNGKYKFETIRPAPYHSHGGEPALIHYTVQGPDYPEYWLTGIWFADDPRVTDKYINNVKRSGGFSNVLVLRKDENNVLRGVRNIILEKFEK